MGDNYNSHVFFYRLHLAFKNDPWFTRPKRPPSNAPLGTSPLADAQKLAEELTEGRPVNVPVKVSYWRPGK